MANNNVNFILHAHMPFVRHPEYKRFLEEDWLFESINESYLPLLRMFKSLKKKNIKFKLSMCFSPTLISMLVDPVLQQRYVDYLELHKKLGLKEVARCTKDQPECLDMAKRYLNLIETNLKEYENVYKRNILTGFKELHEFGYIELLASAATNAFLPAYSEYPVAINAQIIVGIQTFIKEFGCRPDGFWLPELGYYPGIEKILAKHGISYVPTSSQSVLFSEDRCDTGVYKPVKTSNGITLFPRDFQITNLVWSEEGYPASKEYREFYRDIGYDLNLDYIRPYIHEPDVRVFTGFKYWAITNKGPEKDYFDREKAMNLAKEHAKNFIFNIGSKGRQVRPNLGSDDPMFTLCFDTELFGHWWYEGIEWLEQFILSSTEELSPVTLTTPNDFLKDKCDFQVIKPALSSWSTGGFAQIWIDGSNNWIYRHTHKTVERMVELSDRYPRQESLKKRFLNQAAREVLLSMAGDWPYLLYNQSNAEFAKNQLESHIENFNVVYTNMCKNAVNTEWLVKAEARDTIFPFIDYNIFNFRDDF
ncbi:MAG: glycoside hydrolase family 57 protein [Sphaerochaeta sp.]